MTNETAPVVLHSITIEHEGQTYTVAHKSNGLAIVYRGAEIDDSKRTPVMAPITRTIRNIYLAQFPIVHA